jgi:hypothetical protein
LPSTYLTIRVFRPVVSDATAPRRLLPRAALTFVLRIFLKNLKNDILADLYRLLSDGNSLSASYSGNGTLTLVPSPLL